MRSNVSGGRGGDMVVFTIAGALDAGLEPENEKREEASESLQHERWSLTGN